MSWRNWSVVSVLEIVVIACVLAVLLSLALGGTLAKWEQYTWVSNVALWVWIARTRRQRNG